MKGNSIICYTFHYYFMYLITCPYVKEEYVLKQMMSSMYLHRTEELTQDKTTRKLHKTD